MTVFGRISLEYSIQNNLASTHACYFFFDHASFYFIKKLQRFRNRPITQSFSFFYTS
uniref:Uncharacterized protein n=1 Tax=Rhizophora mucronata TaxID=61149 RepID=A0A2P2JP11_RHIMU